MERAYIRACGKVAYYLVIGDTERLAFWTNRKRCCEEDLGMKSAA